jgi:hypothetical protein
MTWWNSFVKWLRSLVGLPPVTPPVGQPEPMRRQVLLLVFNPVIPSHGGRKLTEVLNWNDPDRLAHDYADDLRDVSGGLADFQIVDRIEVDGWPVKIDGFRYDPDGYLACWSSRGGWHEPDQADYAKIVADFKLLERAAAGEIDEVWMFGSPAAGFWESSMVGPGAFWCNSAPLLSTGAAGRRFIMMGFNFERGVGEMLEDFGHRVEAHLERVWQYESSEQNLWKRFTRYDKIAPGQADCGNVHYAPNSSSDYDWGNPRYVPSTCDDWLTFPDFKEVVKQVNSAEWGGGDIRAHHRWWLHHLPRAAGQTNGISNNWWAFAVDPNTVS